MNRTRINHTLKLGSAALAMGVALSGCTVLGIPISGPTTPATTGTPKAGQSAATPTANTTTAPSQGLTPAQIQAIAEAAARSAVAAQQANQAQQGQATPTASAGSQAQSASTPTAKAAAANQAAPSSGSVNPSFPVNSGAGVAPQTVEEAARVLNVDTPQLLTVLYARPGDATAIGWVLGTSASESARMRVSARTVPANVCVDFDQNESTLTGSVSRSERLMASWTRSLLSEPGSFSGLKATFYWSPCNFTSAGSGPAQPTSNTSAASNQAVVAAAAVQPAPTASAATTSQATQGNTCLTKDNITTIGGDARYWVEMPGTNGEGWKYGGRDNPAPIAQLTAPDHGKLDTTVGTMKNGQVAKTNEATYWCNGQ